MTRITFLLNLASAAVVGAALRAYKLHDQAITGDEWHSFRAASTSSILTLIGTLEAGAHYSVPEAVFFRLLSCGLAVSESVIYAPYLLAGILGIVLIPTSLVKSVRGAGTILPWAIAISPTLVLYSRYARPYGLVAIFAILAVTVFVRFLEHQRTKDLLAYACLATLATWLHVVAAPFVFAPLILYLGRNLENRAVALRAVRVVFVSTAPVLLLVAGPIVHNPRAIADKVGQGDLSVSSALIGLASTIGSPEISVAAPILLLCVLGSIDIFSSPRSRPLLLHYVFASATQLGVILIAKPVAVQGPHIFARYAIPLTILVLIVGSAGLSRMVSLLCGPAFYRAVTILLVLAAFFFQTTFGVLKAGGSQMNLSMIAFLIYGSDWEIIVTERLSSGKREPYRRLEGLEPGSLAILEIPYKANDYYLPTRQLTHRQRVLYGVTDGFCSNAGALDLRRPLEMLRLTKTVAVRTPADLAARNLDLAILHRDISSETTYRPEFDPYDLGRCVDLFRRHFGAPIHDKDGLVVFAISDAGRRAMTEPIAGIAKDQQ